MKKIIKIFLLIAFLLAACTAQNMAVSETETPALIKETNLPTNSPTQTPTQIPTVNSSSGQVLTFWHPWTGIKAASIAALVEEYNESNPDGITIEVTAAGDSDYLVSKMTEAIESNTAPDIVAAPSIFLRSVYSEQGSFIGLDDYVNDENLGIPAEEQKTIPVSFWNQDIINGVRYGIPAEYTPHFLFYNQTWAQELGFENAPTTSEEFLNQACSAASYNANDTNDENNGTGGWIYNTDAVSMLSWMQVFGGGEIPAETQRGFSFNTKANQDALEFLRTIYQLDCAWTGKVDAPYRYFSKRYALFYSGTMDDWYQQISMDEIEENSDVWTVIAYPGNEGSPVMNGESLSYGISQTTAAREQAAWNFIRWLISNDVQTTLAEETFSLPVNLAAAQTLSTFLGENPAWQRALTFLPFTKPTPMIKSWDLIGDLLEDAGWQLSLYTIKEADIPTILENLESMANEGMDGN
ncbi:MAG: extracellular solute-binding protein [Anaerolineaceae bacterium]